MAEIEMTIIVKNDDLKAAAEEDMRELIDAGRAEIFTFDEFGEYLVKLMQPYVDKLGEHIKLVGEHIARLTGKEIEAEDESEIPDPDDIGEVIAEAALKTWYDRGERSQAQPPGPRKRVVKPDPPGLVTNEPFEHIPDPDPGDKGLIEAAKRTWSKGRSMLGGGS